MKACFKIHKASQRIQKTFVMKRIVKGLMVLLLMGGLSTGPDINRASAAPPRISVQVFFDALSPYGRWITYGSYGYAWIPSVEVGFIPYATAGHWVFTSLGWTWVSDYPWGWAPFHYGRWVYDDYYGWIWIPGTEWAPAWVVWAQSDDYYGWAPLPPGVDISVHISIGQYIPYSRWVFIPGAYLCSPAPYRYYVYPRNHVTIVQHITIINQVYVQDRGPRYFYGPRPEVVQRYVGRPLRPIPIVDASRPEETRVEGNAVRIFRPAVQQIPNASPRVFANNTTQESRMAANDHVRFMSPFRSNTGAAASGQTPDVPRTFAPAGNPSPYRTQASGEANVNAPATDGAPANPDNNPTMRVRRFTPTPVDRTPAPAASERRVYQPPVNPEQAHGPAADRNSAPARVFRSSSPDAMSPAPAQPQNRYRPDAFSHPIMRQAPAHTFDRSSVNPREQNDRRFQNGNERRHF